MSGVRPTAQAILLVSFLVASTGACVAQGSMPWPYELFQDRRTAPRHAPDRRYHPPPSDTRGEIRDGGARPSIDAVIPPVVPFAHDFPVNSIVIDTGERRLYYVLGANRAYQYPISVGREGFNWIGVERISRKQAWPDWYPPAEMRERDPTLPEKMTGGIKNPLGAMALYLGDTLYRIHGTNDVKSIGRSESSGCFRMLNSAVMHLASITEIGTPVSVVNSLPSQHEVSRAPTAPSEDNNQTGPPQRARDYQSLREYTLKTK
jgi:lipoprotein-anchoring transpeptidase ErfK/SrfK